MRDCHAQIVSSTLRKGGFSPRSQDPGLFFVSTIIPVMTSIRNTTPSTKARTAVAKHLTPADYLKKILTARVYDVAIESPLEVAKQL